MGLSEIIISLEMGLIYGIIAMGIYLSFRVLDFPDLTCDGSFVLGAAVCTMLIKAGYTAYLALLSALLAGALAGVLTGILHTRFKISDLLSGILIGFMLYSINLRIMGGVPNISLFELTSFLSTSPLLILIGISFILWGGLTYLLKSDLGLALRSLGHNKRLAQNNGVNVPLMTIIVLALSNGLIAMGGALFSQHQGFADISSGVGTVIIGLASVMIGERILPFSSLSFKLLGCLLGSILYRLFISFALHSDLLGIDTQNLNLITGLLIIAIMMMPKRQAC